MNILSHSCTLTGGETTPIEDQCYIGKSLETQDRFVGFRVNALDGVQVQVLDDADLGGAVEDDFVDVLHHEGDHEDWHDIPVNLLNDTPLLCCGNRADWRISDQLEGNIIFRNVGPRSIFCVEASLDFLVRGSGLLFSVHCERWHESLLFAKRNFLKESEQLSVRSNLNWLSERGLKVFICTGQPPLHNLRSKLLSTTDRIPWTMSTG